MTDTAIEIRAGWSFAQVPNACWQDYCHRPSRDGKPPGAYGIALYTVLCAHADRHAGDCYPSLQRLCDATGLSKSTVALTLRRMEEVGMIRRKERFADNGARTSTVYVLPEIKANTPTPLSATRTGPVREADPPCPPHGHEQESDEQETGNKTTNGSGSNNETPGPTHQAGSTGVVPSQVKAQVTIIDGPAVQEGIEEELAPGPVPGPLVRRLADEVWAARFTRPLIPITYTPLEDLVRLETTIAQFRGVPGGIPAALELLERELGPAGEPPDALREITEKQNSAWERTALRWLNTTLLRILKRLQAGPAAPARSRSQQQTLTLPAPPPMTSGRPHGMTDDEWQAFLQDSGESSHNRRRSSRLATA